MIAIIPRLACAGTERVASGVAFLLSDGSPFCVGYGLGEHSFCAARRLSRVHASTHAPPAAFHEYYRTSRCSKRISWARSLRTAWKASSGSFVFRELHAGASAARRAALTTGRILLRSCRLVEVGVEGRERDHEDRERNSQVCPAKHQDGGDYTPPHLSRRRTSGIGGRRSGRQSA
jgi:hypothetical protein